jgi:hypothetical protein
MRFLIQDYIGFSSFISNHLEKKIMCSGKLFDAYHECGYKIMKTDVTDPH